MRLQVNRSQGAFIASTKKFRAYVGGLGSGKTFIGCCSMIKHIGQNPCVNVGYFAPSYPQIRDIFYPTIEKVAELLNFSVEIKPANKEVHFYNGRKYYGTCICRSMQNPESIVGFEIGNALVDELDVMATNKAERAWRKIIARMRNKDGRNGVDVTTTPEGFKYTYKMFVKEKTESYWLVHGSTYDNAHNLPEDYITSLYESYPEELREAYLNGQFVNLTSGSVYKNYDRTVCRSTEQIKEKEPLFIGQDFNVSNMFSAIFVKRENVWHCVGELKGIYDTPALIDTLKEKYSDHSITIYPDASGKNRKTADASTSDISLLQQAGFKVRVNKSNPFVKDRVLSVNTAFSKQKVFVNDTLAPDVAEALEKQPYDKNGEPDKTSGFDHPCDAFGYPIAYEMPINKPILATGIRMVR